MQMARSVAEPLGIFEANLLMISDRELETRVVNLPSV